MSFNCKFICVCNHSNICSGIHTRIQKIKSVFFTLFLVFSVSFFSGCASVGIMKEFYTDPKVLPVEVICPRDCEFSWQSVCEGVEYTEFFIDDIKVEWACVRIDLDTPGLTIDFTPYKETLGKKYRVRKTKFKTSGIPVVSVNTTPFRFEGNKGFPTGIVKYDDELICPPNNKKKEYAALCFSAPDLENCIGWRACIVAPQTSDEISSYPFVTGGFHQILKDGKMFSFYEAKRSRTACGLADSGRFIYFLAACGKNCPTGRNGLNFEECAIIFSAMGCSDAMELDGGHSTGLVINGKDIIRPSLQRKVAASMGFFIN